MDNSVRSKIQDFFSHHTLVSYDKGAVITMPGEEPPGIIHLLEGHAGQFAINSRGNKFVLNIFKPPAFFPMSWALNRTPNEYLFEALAPIKARRAPAPEVVAFLQSNPDVTLDLLGRVYRGTDGVLRRLTHLLGGTATSRLASEIFIECLRFGKNEPSGMFTIEITHDDLAARTGLARETVTRELHKLKESGLIHTDARSIVVPDLQALEDLLSAT